jgi:hypothetical protein
MRDFIFKPVLIIILMMAVQACAVQKEQVETVKTQKTDETVKTIFETTSDAYYRYGMDTLGQFLWESNSVTYSPNTMVMSDKPFRAIIEQITQTTKKGDDAYEMDSMQINTYIIEPDTLKLQSRIQCVAKYAKVSDLSGNLIETQTFGHGKAEDGKQLFSLVNGNHLATYGDEYANLVIPNTMVKRVIAYHDLNNIVPLPEEEVNKGLIGILYYSSTKEVINKIGIYAKDLSMTERFKFSRPFMFLIVKRNGHDIRVSDLELWPENPSKFTSVPTGFFIEFNFNYMKNIGEFRIPVIDDKVVIDSVHVKQLNFRYLE